MDVEKYDTFREVIENVYLPQALTIGVDYDLFWSLNPRKLQPFVKSFEMKQKMKTEYINFQTWLQGIYFGKALVASLDKNQEYFKEPIDFQKIKEQKSQEELMAMKFEAWSVAFNQSLEKGGK